MTLLDNFEWTTERWGRALRSPVLAVAAAHLFTTRQLRLRGPSEADEWARVADALGVPADRLMRLQQVHGTAVVTLRRNDKLPDAAGGRPEADAVITDDPSIGVAVQVADCVPLLVADRRRRAVAAVHAGWRGTCAGVAASAVNALREAFGVEPADLLVAAGPSIGPCCYNVGQEVLDAFAASHVEKEVGRWFSRDTSGGLTLDLWRANADQLEAAGVPSGSIRVSALCTACHTELFHSYRREGPGTGRIAAAIRLA